MNRPNAIALGLSALTVGAVAATARPTTLPKPRPVPPSDARHAFANKDIIVVRQGPNDTAPEVARLGLGSGMLVHPRELEGGYLAIVREWVEGNARFSHDLGFVRSADVVFTDPLRRPASAIVARGIAPKIGEGQEPPKDRSDGGECDVFFTVTWPSAVDHFKQRLDAVWQATDRSVQSCAALSQDEKDAWGLLYGRWKTFAATPTPYVGSGAHWDQTCAWSRTLDGERKKIAQVKCNIVGPINIQGYELPAGVSASISNVATIVKWGALGIGGAVLVATVLPEIRAALGALRARRT